MANTLADQDPFIGFARVVETQTDYDNDCVVLGLNPLFIHLGTFDTRALDAMRRTPQVKDNISLILVVKRSLATEAISVGDTCRFNHVCYRGGAQSVKIEPLFATHINPSNYKTAFLYNNIIGAPEGRLRYGMGYSKYLSSTRLIEIYDTTNRNL
jgi:hypothetical protein